MDAQTENRHIPLCVDLDGTLVATDTLWEGVVAILARNPLMVFLLIGWAVRGKACLKAQVAARATHGPADWPYRDDVLAWLDGQKAAGRSLVLVTGAADAVAESVAGHIGVFDSVMHGSPDHNLTAGRKRAALIERFGEGGFDYAGNSRDDIGIFDVARSAVLVAPDRAARRWQRDHDCTVIAPRTRTPLRTVLKAVRVHQWLKNTLIAVPLVLNHALVFPALDLAVVIAFFSFSFAASAVYLLNDIVDIGHDRRHATKRFRPIASGEMTIPHAFGLAASLAAASLALSFLLPWAFLGVLAIYGVATTAYSFFLKRKLLVDVFTLASLYTIRIIAGIAATGSDMSFWLLAFSIFFFLSLALVKRYVELADVVAGNTESRPAGRGYYAGDFDMIGQAGIASAFAAAMVLALYINSGQVLEMYPLPWMLWPLGPMVLYMLLRIWMLARRSQLHEDPVVFIMRDWRSQAVTVAGALLVLIAAY